MSKTYTLISADTGDQVPGVELGELEATDGGELISLADLARLTDVPQVREFFADNRYDADHPAEVMYLVEGEWESSRFPTLTVALQPAVSLATLDLGDVTRAQLLEIALRWEDRGGPVLDGIQHIPDQRLMALDGFAAGEEYSIFEYLPEYNGTAGWSGDQRAVYESWVNQLNDEVAAEVDRRGLERAERLPG